MKFVKQLLILLIFSGAAVAQQASLYSDVKGVGVGDILSVIVIENANATRGSRSNSDVNSDMSMSGAVTGDAAVLLPKVGVASRSAASYDGNEETQQRDRLTGRISVQIIEKTDNGNYRIEGTRRLGINGEENLMTITGVVRPQDVMSNNTIYSYNIADSKITYRRTGLVNKMSSPRTITKLVTFAVVGAAAVFAATNLSF